jgi:HD superfamily phosphohydrolase YqeK
MACILHDTCKYGQSGFDKEQYKDHAKNACALVNEAWFDCYGVNASEFFLSAIKCHMGQWSEREDRPFTNIDRCVHMADYMASRSFIDIPQVVEEYQAVTCEPNNEHCYMCSQLQSCNYIKAIKTRECGKGA